MAKNNDILLSDKIRLGEISASQAMYTGSSPVIRIFPTGEKEENQRQVNQSYLYEYLEVRKLENLSEKWLYQIQLFLRDYLESCNYSLSRGKTITYLNLIRKKYHQTTFRKREYQIRRFLRYLDLNYMEKVKIIPEPTYTPARIEEKRIRECIEYFAWRKYGLQAKALILLGYDTGLRPSELYRLKNEDIDLKHRTIELRSSKTDKERIVFFTKGTKEVIQAYLSYHEKNERLLYLFGEMHCRRMFSEAPLKIKMLRKAFAQKFIKRGGNFVALKQILGHSIRSDVTMSHYVLLSDEELQKEYNRVMN